MRALLIGAVAVIGLCVGAWLYLKPSPVVEVCTNETRATAPSGRVVTLCEVLFETQPSGAEWAVVRVLDPDLPPASAASDHVDHDWICETWGVPKTNPETARVIVQIMQAAFVRGEAAPGISQSIEAYSLDDGTCIWELL